MSALANQRFKQTEIGVIPEDWHYSKLSEVCVTSSGTTPARSQFDRYFRNGNINWVKTLDLNNGEILKTDEQVTKDALAETSLKLYPVKTVLIAMYGGFNQIGRTGLLRVPACVNQAITAIQCGNQITPEYLLATLNFRVEHWKAVASSSRKDPNITSQDVRDFQIVYPSRDEQEQIAESLSCIDSLIRSLDQLVAKKRDIQQAAMQQLLTGQLRLPGFSEGWLKIKAGEIGTFRGGSGFPNKFQGEASGDFPFYKVSDMNNKGNDVFMSTANNYINEGVRKAIGSIVFPANSIVFAKVGAAVFLERKKILTRPSCLDNNMAAFIVDERLVCVRFMHYALLNIRLSDLVSTTALPSLGGSVLSNIELHLPPLAEQTAIASALSDIDAELTTLESRCEKARQLRQGMMQELLTGRIRLTNSAL